MAEKTTVKSIEELRGPRPRLRGWVHVIAAVASLISGVVITTFAGLHLELLEAFGVAVYAVGLTALFAVSGAYHRGPWRSATTVQWWRRADHAMICVFIACTYTPLCLIVLEPPVSVIMLTVIWVAALAGVGLAMVWIEHPRWVDVVVYLGLGWAIIPLLPQLVADAGWPVVILLAAGGVIYSLGAVIYGLKWPGRNARWYGYHEHFHTATVIAAILHLVAMWMVVTAAA